MSITVPRAKEEVQRQLNHTELRALLSLWVWFPPWRFSMSQLRAFGCVVYDSVSLVIPARIPVQYIDICKRSLGLFDIEFMSSSLKLLNDKQEFRAGIPNHHQNGVSVGQREFDPQAKLDVNCLLWHFSTSLFTILLRASFPHPPWWPLALYKLHGSNLPGLLPPDISELSSFITSLLGHLKLWRASQSWELREGSHYGVRLAVFMCCPLGVFVFKKA